jgi:hypothetical protein
MRAEEKALGSETEHALGRRSGQAAGDETVEEHLLDRAVVTSPEDLGRAQVAYDAVEKILRGRRVRRAQGDRADAARAGGAARAAGRGGQA